MWEVIWQVFNRPVQENHLCLLRELHTLLHKLSVLPSWWSALSLSLSKLAATCLPPDWLPQHSHVHAVGFSAVVYSRELLVKSWWSAWKSCLQPPFECLHSLPLFCIVLFVLCSWCNVCNVKKHCKTICLPGIMRKLSTIWVFFVCFLTLLRLHFLVSYNRLSWNYLHPFFDNSSQSLCFFIWQNFPFPKYTKPYICWPMRRYF